VVTIKAAAELTGLTVKAIRHYEQIGLVQPPLRTDAGYRLYSTENIFRLRQIQYYRELKFSLQEIAVLLDAPRETVLSALTRQRQVVDERLEEYHRARSVLQAALSAGEQMPCRAAGTPGLAIIAIDLQNDLLEGGALPCRRIRDILPPLKTLFEQARKLGVPIIYICDWHQKDDPELLLWNDHMKAGSWGSQIISEVAPQTGDYVIHKNLFNGFIGTDLQDILDLLQVHTLLFTGWRTHVCIAQSAIEAFYRRYRVVIAGDGVNSTTRSEHEYGMSLMQINYGFAVLSCANALKTLLESGQGADGGESF